jgi:hypothetical protein
MRGLLDVVIAFWKRKTMNFRELALDGITALLGLSLFMSATSLASALNHWAARQYIRFPKMKLLPGAANAGTELNAKITTILFRTCGALICVVSLLSITHEALLALR